MYGHTIGWSSSALPYIRAGLGPGGEEVGAAKAGWVGGSYCLGALFSAPFHGMLVDWKGRKIGGYVVALSFAFHWIFMLLATNFWWILVARFIGGVGGSGSITVATIYTNEIAESRLKSALGGLIALLYVSGVFTSYIFGPLLSFDNTSIAYLFPTLIFLPLWWKMPESPAYLLLKKEYEKALESIQWLLKTDRSEAEKVAERILMEQAGAAKAFSMKELFLDRASRKAVFLGSFLIFVQTFSGIFACHSYLEEIFNKVGGSLSTYAATLIYGSMMILGALVPPVIADKAPRKVLMFISTGGVGVGMAILSVQQWATSKGYIPDDNYFIKIIPAIILPMNCFAYYVGLGSVIYIIMAELFTDEARGVGNGFLSGIIWLSGYILLQFFGISVETFGDYTVFGFFALVCLTGIIFLVVALPETRGKSTMEVVAILLKNKQ